MKSNPTELNLKTSFSHPWPEAIDKNPRTWYPLKWIRSLWQGFIEGLAPSTEIKIFTHRDRHGNTYYRVYDASTQDFYDFDSESEVRIWLERRYYR